MYQFHPSLARFLHSKRVRNIQSLLSILQQKEGLVWPLGRASFLRGEDNAEGIGDCERDGLRQWRGGG